MNKQRRKWLESIISQLEAQKDELDTLQCEEQDAYDNLPEGIQDSERGEQMQENADDIDSAACDLQDVIDSLNDILER